MKVGINKACGIFGHMSEENTRKLCKYLRLEVKYVGFKLHVCDECAAGQIKKENYILKKRQHISSQKPNGNK